MSVGNRRGHQGGRYLSKDGDGKGTKTYIMRIATVMCAVFKRSLFFFIFILTLMSVANRALLASSAQSWGPLRPSVSPYSSSNPLVNDEMPQSRRYQPNGTHYTHIRFVGAAFFAHDR